MAGQGREDEEKVGQGRAGQGREGYGANLKQPDLPAVIHHQVKPKQLKAVG